MVQSTKQHAFKLIIQILVLLAKELFEVLQRSTARLIAGIVRLDIPQQIGKLVLLVRTFCTNMKSKSRVDLIIGETSAGAPEKVSAVNGAALVLTGGRGFI